ncbi:unnamed protein product [Adineta steineri]|uniref:Uncharacterized protein n=1 Tax=Adineta steineri TaxID=433720 RepID=A0A814S516_9BILA|nr:unnamed protein product [Adineta steineri]CAF3863777.1 unnamed protein product [Adineta steineri]CAF4009276.1 unnamed protein product [Adineta steineri]
MAKKPSTLFTDGGLWNNGRPEHKTEMTRVEKTIADEARVNNFQFSQLTSGMLRGATLSAKPEASSIQSSVPIKKRVKPIRPSNTSNPSGLRTYNDIVKSNAYAQPDYYPGPIKGRTDYEKDRLGNLMAYGIDPSKMPYEPAEHLSSSHEIDRFDELVLEIEERKEFLEQMILLGKRKEYQEIISNEIADKIREMEQIDRQRSKALEKRLNKR